MSSAEGTSIKAPRGLDLGRGVPVTNGGGVWGVGCAPPRKFFNFLPWSGAFYHFVCILTHD